MRYGKTAIGVCVFSLFVCLAATAALGDTIGPITLTLAPDGQYDNQLDLTIALDTEHGLFSDTQSSLAGGAILANLDATFDPATRAATVSGIGFIRNHPYDPAQQAISFADMTFSYPALGTTINTENLKGTIGTPDPFGAVSGGSFSADSHVVYINSGTFTAAGGLDATLPLDMFWVGAASSGTGSITVGDPIIDGNLATYSVELIMPVQFNEPIEEIGATAGASGTIRATGTFTQVVPEPGTLVSMFGAMMGLIIYGWLRRGR